jgi:Zn-dependent protease with chaperone function
LSAVGSSGRCPPLWGLAGAWLVSISLLAFLAVRWIGWTSGANGLPQAWALAVPALALLAAGLLGLARSLVRQLRAGLDVAEWVRLRTIPARPWLEAAIAEAGVRRYRLVDDEQPYAFTFGVLRPVVVVSSGLLERLETGSLRAVLAHEAAHARRRDPGRLMLARALAAGLLRVPPAVRAEGRCHQWVELAADRAALSRLGRRPLAAALLALLQRPESTRPRSSASVVDAADLIPVRLAQLSSYPEPARLPRAHGRRERLATGALVAATASVAALPCPLFAAVLERIPV